MTIFEYILFYIVFGILILSAIKICPNKSEVISLEDSYCIKGIAMIFICISHWVQIFLESGGNDKIINVFVRMGCIGVAVFFFLSGYGLEKSQDINRYWNKKIRKIVLPYMCINAIFYVVIYGVSIPLTANNILSLFGLSNPLWYIAVIMIYYFAWWMCLKYLKKWRLILVFVSTIAVLMLFYLLGFEEYWYNAGLAFPLGIFVQHYEKKIQMFLSKRYIFNIVVILITLVIVACINELWLDSFPLAGKNVVLIVFCMLMYTFLSKYEMKQKILYFIGQNTLFIYIIHSLILQVFRRGKIFYPQSTILFVTLITVLTIGYATVVKLTHKVGERWKKLKEKHI